MSRICYVRHKYYPNATPTRRNAEAAVAAGWDADVICLNNREYKRRETVNGVNVYRLPVDHRRASKLRYIFEYSAFFILAALQLSWLSLIRRYKVIQVDNMPDFLVFTALVPKLLGAKIELQILDHSPEVFMDGFRVGDKHPIVRCLRLLEKASAVWSDHVTVTQGASKKILVNMGVRPDKISVILNVPDEATFRKPEAAGSGNGRFRIMTHGRIVERYCIDTLVKAVPHILKEIPNLEVKIVGDGEGLPALKKLSGQLGVDGFVSYTGWLDAAEIPSHIAEADVCVVVIPAGANPAMPNKLFEYSALGKPAVVTSIPTIKQYYTPETVMYYQPGDEKDLARCVVALYRDPERRRRLGTGAADVYEKYRWNKTRGNYTGMLSGLLKEGAAS